MKKLTIDNVTYKSLAEAWFTLTDWTVSYALTRKRVSRGWTPKKAIITPPIDPVNRRSGIS